MSTPGSPAVTSAGGGAGSGGDGSGGTAAPGSRATPVTPSLLRGWPLPSAGEDKYSRGAVMVIGGARATPGAALLAGTAALRAGAGRLTMAVAESVAAQLAVSFPEAGVIGLPETEDGSVRGSGLEPAFGDLESADAVLIGPGLDDADRTEDLLRTLLERDDDGGSTGGGSGTGGATIILDAYALGCLPRLGDALQPWHGRLILTPNPKEAGILLGREVDQLESAVRDIAGQYQAVVSCQGFIARPPDGAGAGRSRTLGNHHRLRRPGDLRQRGRSGRRHRRAPRTGCQRRPGRVLGNPPSCGSRRQARQQAGSAGIPGPRTGRRTAGAHAGAGQPDRLLSSMPAGGLLRQRLPRTQ